MQIIKVTLFQTKISPSPGFKNFSGCREKANKDRMEAQQSNPMTQKQV